MGLFDSIRRVVGGESADAEETATDDDADLIATRSLDVTALRREAEGVASEVEQLDFSLASLEQFDAAIEAGYDDELPTAEDPETYPRDVVRFGCYLGEVLVRVYGGRWEQDPEWGVTVSGREDEATVAVFRVATRSITDEPVFAAVAERVAAEVGLEADDTAEESGDGEPADESSGSEAGSDTSPEPTDDTSSETDADEQESAERDDPETDAEDDLPTAEDDVPPATADPDAASTADSDGASGPRQPDALKSGVGPVDGSETEAAADDTARSEPGADDPAASASEGPDHDTAGEESDDDTEATAPDSAADDVASLVEEAEPDTDDSWFEEESEGATTEEAGGDAATETGDEPADTADDEPADTDQSLFGGDETDADPMPPAGEAGTGDTATATDEDATAESDPTEGDDLRADYAEEAEAFVAFWSEHDLDYTPDSLARLDDLVAAEWDDDRFAEATLGSDETFDDRAFTSVVTELGSYFGEVLVRELDAEWSDETTNDSVVVDGVDGHLAIPVFRVAETSLRKAPVFARSYDSLLDDLGRS